MEDRIEENAYSKRSNLTFVESFAGNIDKGEGDSYIPTGFTELDKVFDGGLFEGLYIIGAITTLGKTSFILQMADQIAKRGHDVLFYSIEMARRELTAKSLSRLTFLANGNKRGMTMRDLTVKKKIMSYSEEDKKNVKETIKQYKTFAGNIFIEECDDTFKLDSIGDGVRKHIAERKKKPVVMIDYLQLVEASSEDGRMMSDKQTTDRTVLVLKRLARDLGLPIIGISSFNRNNYQNSAAFESFKESGSIEYSSDVLIGIEYEKNGTEEKIKEQMKKDPRIIKVNILKNRNGATGEEITYEYYPKFSYFRESGQ